MKKIQFFFTLLIIYCSLFIGSANAQWWTSGGNLIWPYGDVVIPNGNLTVGKSLIGAHGPTWDFQHQRKSFSGSGYDLVYWVDGTFGNDNNDGKTNRTAYKTIKKLNEVMPEDLEGRTAFVLLPAGQTLTFNENIWFYKKNGNIVFKWVGAWIDQVSYSDQDKFGLWLNPDSTAHKLVGNNGQVLFNFHGHNLTLTGDKTIQYIFDSFDNRIPYGNNSHRHYYNRFVFYTDVSQAEYLTFQDCKFSNYNAWGMEIRMQNIVYRAVVFNGMYSGWCNGFKIQGHAGFTSINDWVGAVVFSNNKIDFNVDRAWEPSGYYASGYACPSGEYINWEIIAMGERQLFAFEDTNFGRFNFWNMTYTQGDIPQTGLPYFWISYYGLSGNIITYLSSRMYPKTDRCLNIHILDDKSTNKSYQYFNTNLKQDADTLKVTKLIKFDSLPNDSTNLKKGMLYFDRLTGVIKRKF